MGAFALVLSPLEEPEPALEGDLASASALIAGMSSLRGEPDSSEGGVNDRSVLIGGGDELLGELSRSAKGQ